MKYIFWACFSLCFLSSYGYCRDFEQNLDHLTSQSQLETLGTSLGGASSDEPRSLLPLALDLIKDFEQWIEYAYNDAANYCTIGFGHLIAKKSCESIADLGEFSGKLELADGLQILEEDTWAARSTVARLVNVQIDDNQFGALSSFVFNIGSKNFKRSTLLRLLNAGDHKAASKQFSRWILAKGEVLNGLINRRACEAALFRGELQYRKDGRFYRSDCEGLGAAPSGENLVDITEGE